MAKKTISLPNGYLRRIGSVWNAHGFPSLCAALKHLVVYLGLDPDIPLAHLIGLTFEIISLLSTWKYHVLLPLIPCIKLSRWLSYFKCGSSPYHSWLFCLIFAPHLCCSKYPCETFRHSQTPHCQSQHFRSWTWCCNWKRFWSVFQSALHGIMGWCLPSKWFIREEPLHWFWYLHIWHLCFSFVTKLLHLPKILRKPK